MAQFLFLIILLSFSLLGLCHADSRCEADPLTKPFKVYSTDIEQLQFALNLEHIETEFFLYGALGFGLDKVDPNLANGGPPPIGAKVANLDNLTRNIIAEFGYQEVGHLRAIKSIVGRFPRPQLDLSAKHFAKIMDEAIGYQLKPPFDPYNNTINYLLASYTIPYVGLVAYVGANPHLNSGVSKRLLAGLLAVEAGQDAVIRALLYEHAHEVVQPYNKLNVNDFTNRISGLRNKLAGCGIKDEGLWVPRQLGAEKKTTSNILSADANSVAYERTPAEILRIVYGTGSEKKPGGFLPKGGNGTIAEGFLKH